MPHCEMGQSNVPLRRALHYEVVVRFDGVIVWAHAQVALTLSTRIQSPKKPAAAYSGGFGTDTERLKSSLEPLEFPSSDSAVMNRRTNQDRRGAGFAEIDDLFNSRDPASHGEQDRAIAVANLLHQAARAEAPARSHASEIQNQQVSHAAVDRGLGQLTGALGPPGCRRRRFSDFRRTGRD